MNIGVITNVRQYLYMAIQVLLLLMHIWYLCGNSN